jgi:hypothetical protein
VERVQALLEGLAGAGAVDVDHLLRALEAN